MGCNIIYNHKGPMILNITHGCPCAGPNESIDVVVNPGQRKLKHFYLCRSNLARLNGGSERKSLRETTNSYLALGSCNSCATTHRMYTENDPKH